MHMMYCRRDNWSYCNRRQWYRPGRCWKSAGCPEWWNFWWPGYPRRGTD